MYNLAVSSQENKVFRRTVDGAAGATAQAEQLTVEKLQQAAGASKNPAAGAQRNEDSTVAAGAVPLILNAALLRAYPPAKQNIAASLLRNIIGSQQSRDAIRACIAP